jgi:AcrR family transcriptional regulator
MGPGETSSARLASERQERRWESRRDLIVRAAVDVFAEMGIEGATLDAVGERVGLTKASLYYYVKSKEELLGHVVGHVLRAQEQAMAELTHDGMTPEDRLRPVDLGVARNSVLSALNAVTLWYVPDGPLTVDDVGNEICDLVIGGLRPPKT